jgi:hypothetical protein
MNVFIASPVFWEPADMNQKLKRYALWTDLTHHGVHPKTKAEKIFWHGGAAFWAESRSGNPA